MNAKTSEKCRLTNKEIAEKNARKRNAEQILSHHQKEQGLNKVHRESLPNRKCPYTTVAEEKDNREKAVTEQLMIIRANLPILLKRLSGITDPRQPKKCKHKMTVILIYGILSFVFMMSSRREANKEMTRPVFMENLRLFFPKLDTLPHNDTLKRLLDEIEVSRIEEAHVNLIRNFIRKKKFQRFLINYCYPIAIDGTQKFSRTNIWSEECLERTIHQGKDKQYYVYVLEATLAFHNGMNLPLMSEFLNYAEGDTENNKQDCETKAFHRLAKRLKQEFPRLPIMVLLDGLYPNGPIMECCLKKGWQFMIVLKDMSLKSVWEEYNALKDIDTNNRRKMKWGNRIQYFQWVNDLEYWYGDQKKVMLHVVVCEESWQSVNSKGQLEDNHSRHAWISSKPLAYDNVHERCNLGARHRWGIETELLVEKCHGFQYEHCFSYNWNSMKGYHYLMRIGHLFIVLARYSEVLVDMFNELGIKGFINFIRETISGPWLDEASVFKRLNRNFQLRLV